MKPKLDCGGFGPADTKTCINTPAGVASLVAAIPFAALFSGYLCMVTVLPQMSRERASFYRERFSKMYSPEIHGLAYFLSEIPYSACPAALCSVSTTSARACPAALCSASTASARACHAALCSASTASAHSCV